MTHLMLLKQSDNKFRKISTVPYEEQQELTKKKEQNETKTSLMIQLEVN